MKPLTLITHHYNGHDRVITLLDHIASFAEDIRSKLSIIVVDDYSDENQALPKYGLDITQYRVLTDIPWNQCGARNLGVFMSQTPWALLFDVDQHPRERGIKYILHHYEQLQPDTMYSFRVSNYFDANDHQALEVHPNTLLVPVTNFKEFGMYDEDFAGNYGYEDLYLPVMWEMRGGKRIVLGKEIYFDDVGYKTSSLSRDIEVNKPIAHTKILNGSPKPKNFLRFDWARVNHRE